MSTWKEWKKLTDQLAETLARIERLHALAEAARIEAAEREAR